MSHSSKKKSKLATLRRLAATAGIVAAQALAGGAAAVPASASADRGGAYDSELQFDPSAYTTLNATIDGQPVAVRWYKEVCYVARPQLMAPTQQGNGGPVTIPNPQCGYQSLNIYVLESAAQDQQAAIYFQVNNGGWFAMYTALGTRAAVNVNNDAAGSPEMAASFANYQRSLRLRNPDGSPLRADNMLDTVKAEVIRSAETFMAAGGIIPDLGATLTYTVNGVPTNFVNDWIDVDNDTNKVVSLDMERYLTFVASQAVLKPAPAFDNTGVATFPGGMSENTLFGTRDQAYLNFSEFAWNHNTLAGDASGPDDTGYQWADYVRLPSSTVDEQVRLINPMHYLGGRSDTAPYWYVRHGTRDRDTSFTVSINLARALAADPDVRDLDYRLAWDRPHAGNYDVPEAMAWIAARLAAAPAGARKTER